MGTTAVLRPVMVRSSVGADSVGLLGARSRLGERLARLQAGGISADQLARLKAPIGLPTGGKAPWDSAFDDPKTKDQVLAAAMPFLKS